MSDEPRRLARPPAVPFWPFLETCPACGEKGAETTRCLSHVGKGPAFIGIQEAKPTDPRILECGACGLIRYLPPEYQPIQPDGAGRLESAQVDYVEWSRRYSR